jgi:predicted dehydrogenase
MSEKKVKLAVVGVGGMGSGHCGTVGEIEETELVAVADIVPERAREIGEKHDVPFFTDHRELLEAGLADAVVVATPHYFHPVIAVDAFEAGLHVLSEKPIAVRVGEAEKMVAAAERSGKVFCVMFQMRSQPNVAKAQEIAESGEIGEIQRTLLISPEFRSQAYYDSGSWRATWGGEGGGVLLNQAPHIMDVFVSLGGLPSKVSGRCDTLLHEIEVEDHAEAMLQYENGASGYFYVSTNEAGPRVLEIVGDRGRLRMDGGQLRFWRFETPVKEFNRTNTEMWGSPKREEVELDIEEREAGHKVILEDFARVILHGGELLAPGACGLGSLELANAIILSSYKGEPVELPIDRGEYDALIEELQATSSFQDDWGATRSETDPQFKK